MCNRFIFRLYDILFEDGIFKFIIEFIEEYLNKFLIVRFVLKMFYFNGRYR